MTGLGRHGALGGQPCPTDWKAFANTGFQEGLVPGLSNKPPPKTVVESKAHFWLFTETVGQESRWGTAGRAYLSLSMCGASVGMSRDCAGEAVGKQSLVVVGVEDAWLTVVNAASAHAL